MLRVGLTGGIASGKSEVLRRLADFGAVVIDADRLSREVVAPGTSGLAEVTAEFGPGVLTDAGELDRQRLGQIVFADPAARQRLESIVHPRVRARAAELEAAAAEQDPEAIVVQDIPLLAETGRAADFDVVVVVDVPESLQLERLSRERDMGPEEAESRLASQSTRAERVAVADVIVDNASSLADLDRRVRELWTQLRARTRG